MVETIIDQGTPCCRHKIANHLKLQKNVTQLQCPILQALIISKVLLKLIIIILKFFFRMNCGKL